ncbi:MAG: EpsI family protein [Candidatus Omnitrophica bacterium]|nr:EpsI family protein [Candidatus Omnitrophota bacterium]
MKTNDRVGKNRTATLLLLLAVTMVVAFALPKWKYKGADTLSQVNIPTAMTGWQSVDVSSNLKSKMADQEVYNFVGDVFARAYGNFLGERLLFLVLDAGNFHNPKVCYGASGYKITELDDIELALSDGRKFKAHALSMDKSGEGLTMVYWICIDRKIVGWTEQKFIELWSSIFQKRKAGLMIRLDIPTRKGGTDTAVRLAKDFVKDLSRSLTPEQSEYLFGK